MLERLARHAVRSGSSTTDLAQAQALLFVRSMKITHSTALGIAAVLVGACGHTQSAAAPEQTTTSMSTSASPAAPANPSRTVDTAPTDTPSTGNGTSGMVADNAPGSPEAQPAMTDNQILGFTHAANLGEIEQGRLAQTKAKESKVKAFATMMVKEHSDADARGQALAKKANLKPEPSPAMDSLKSDAESMTKSLKSEAPADFDKAYVDSQVTEHKAVLDSIDQKLIPSATNPDLKAYLANVRNAVATHLQHAEDLQKEMQK